MPAKRIIIGKRLSTLSMSYEYILWADVPAGNQLAYRNPAAVSAYENATAAELQAIRDGQVTEKAESFKASLGTSLATMQAVLEAKWTALQNSITAETPWDEYGRYWSNVPAWNATTGVPWYWPQDADPSIPSFSAFTALSAYAANKFHFVLFNNAPVATSQALILKVHLVAILPGTTVVTGVVPSVWTLRRRENLSTAPAGGIVTPVSADSAHALPAQVTCHNAPTTSPTGGTLVPFLDFIPQADEQKLSTLDAPTVSALFSHCGGQVVYHAKDLGTVRPITIRPNQTLEVQQSATAGTGNCRVLCVFTVG